mgnify:CR=1 FL=1
MLLSFVALFVLSMSVVALAAELPFGTAIGDGKYEEAIVLKVGSDDWFFGFEDGELTVVGDARLIRTGGGDGSCNRQQWEIDFETTAEVAQWIEWRLSATEWDWYIRKPGVYYGDSIQAFIKSNGDVVISFDMEDMTYQGAAAVGTTDTNIEVFYAAVAGTQIPDPDDDFVYGPELEPIRLLDNMGQTFYQGLCPITQTLHDGLWFKLWTKINVENCNSAGLYLGGGTISIEATNQVAWLDGSGDWIGALPPTTGN